MTQESRGVIRYTFIILAQFLARFRARQTNLRIRCVCRILLIIQPTKLNNNEIQTDNLLGYEKPLYPTPSSRLSNQISTLLK